MSRDSSLVPDPSTQTASSQPFQTLPAGGLCRRPEGRRGEGGCFCYSGKGLEWGEEQLLPLPQAFYHIYKYIHKYITYSRESGRQAPHRGLADTVARLRSSGEGRRAPCALSCPG